MIMFSLRPGLCKLREEQKDLKIYSSFTRVNLQSDLTMEIHLGGQQTHPGTSVMSPRVAVPSGLVATASVAQQKGSR